MADILLVALPLTVCKQHLSEDLLSCLQVSLLCQHCAYALGRMGIAWGTVDDECEALHCLIQLPLGSLLELRLCNNELCQVQLTSPDILDLQ